METKLEEVKDLHELRLGWSTDDSNLQVGESALSWCFGGSAKKGNDQKFEDYGVTFAKDDVVSAFVDLSSDPVTFSFAKNGESQGVAFSVAQSELEGKAIFPHISSRNTKFEVNFGKDKDGKDNENWFAPLDGFTMAAEHVATTQRGAPRYTFKIYLAAWRRV
jgi:heterogeneous nuclear ribonucleoprotein U-like protein 1